MLESPTQTDVWGEILNNISPALSIIKYFEGLMNKPYLCPANKWTIGYGHVIIINGKMANGVEYTLESLPGEYKYISDEQAYTLLVDDVTPYIRKVNRLINRKLNINQLCALISFSYNCGINAFRISSLRKYINTNNTLDDIIIKSYFNRWKYAGGVILKGLEKRRDTEAKLFCTPI